MSDDDSDYWEGMEAREMDEDELDDIRKDRDALLTALEATLAYVDKLAAPMIAEFPEMAGLVADDLKEVRALVDRVKAGR